MKSNGNKPNLTFYDAPDKKRLRFAVEDWCVLNEIAGVIYTHTGGSYKSRAFIDALIGISKGRLDWNNRKAESFRASYETLIDQVERFNHDQDQKEKRTYLQNIKRMSNKSRAAQDREGLEWFTQRPGYKDSETGEHISSEFTLPLIEYTLEAYHRARTNPERYESMGPEKRWKMAALEVASEIPRNYVAPKPKKRQSAYQAKQQALAMLERVGDLEMEKTADAKIAKDAIKQVALDVGSKFTARQHGADPLYAASEEGRLDAAAAFVDFYDELEAKFNDLDELETDFDTLEVNQI